MSGAGQVPALGVINSVCALPSALSHLSQPLPDTGLLLSQGGNCDGREVCSWAGAVVSYGSVTGSGHISLMEQL